MTNKSSKLLITGAAGFIGSHLAEYCVELGYNVRAFDRYNPNNHWGWLENSKYKNNIEVILGDVRDYDSVFSVLKGCDTVFHLAALISIPYSYVSPSAYIETNIKGAYNILQAAKMLDLENILITSTSEVYGSAQYVPIDENHPLVGQSPYAATKIGADQLAISYYKSFNLPVKIIRPFNTFGPRQSARAVIPTIISQILNKHQSIFLGNLEPTRDLTFVKDMVQGFIKIHQSEDLWGEVINIGSNHDISIGDLAKKIIKLMNVDIGITQDDKRNRPRASEVDRLCCNNSKLRKYTDWNMEYDLGAGLKDTIQWMRENLKYYKPELYNI